LVFADLRFIGQVNKSTSDNHPIDKRRDRSQLTLRKLKYLLDEAFRIPGTRIRVGWDPIVGLVPWIGDLVTALLSCAIIVQAHRMRIPRLVVLRMLLNVAIDMAAGALPLVGDVADVFWQSNSKNFALLERHADEVKPATLGDWLFVAGVLAAVFAVALAPLVVLYWLVHAVVGRTL
jgi:hypothetical protein